MLKRNKWKILISSLVTLLPILVGIFLWNDLPGSVPTHWGADGNVDGFGSKAFAVFGLPIILFVLNFVCVFFTLSDKRQAAQTEKALGIIFWIVPAISLFANGIIYSTAFEKEFHLERLVPALFGLLLIILGNYLPKIKQNRTLGIKVWWALNNEENWNKTHRFAGKLWVISGLILLFSVFLPGKFMLTTALCVILAIVIIPMVYSYLIYKQHQKQGISYTAMPQTKAEKTTAKFSAIFVPILLIGVAVLMLTGNIDVRYSDKAFTVNASYYQDIKIPYADIDSITYRQDVNAGMRTNGFGSPKLSMGAFENDEFGHYTRYTYTACKASVVLAVDGKTLVINGKTPESTKQIYETLLDKTQK